jgi:bacterioferritin (cytochrome b1)
MKTEEIIKLVNADLKNERKHLHFYQNAAVMVGSLHRQELREFFEEEAASELVHVNQFSELVVHLGGNPEAGINDYPTDLSNPIALLEYAIQMEEEVANNYRLRLVQTHEMETADIAYAHVFYEEQIADSWKTAKELRQLLRDNTQFGSNGGDFSPPSTTGA